MQYIRAQLRVGTIFERNLDKPIIFREIERENIYIFIYTITLVNFWYTCRYTTSRDNRPLSLTTSVILIMNNTYKHVGFLEIYYLMGSQTPLEPCIQIQNGFNILYIYWAKTIIKKINQFRLCMEVWAVSMCLFLALTRYRTPLEPFSAQFAPITLVRGIQIQNRFGLFLVNIRATNRRIL